MAKPSIRAELSEVLKCKVLHVEEAADSLTIVVAGIYTGEGIIKLRKNYEKEVKIVRLEWLKRLMLGLLDEDERLLEVGFFESLQFLERRLIVSTSLADEVAVKYVKFGYLNIDEQGNEIGRRTIGIF